MVDGVKPIYITGRAHSGSTFLDVILNGSDAIKGCGGILEAYSRGPDERCSCSAQVSSCPQWAKVEVAYERRMGRSFHQDVGRLYRMSDIRNFLSALLSNVGPMAADWAWYVEANNALSASIGEVFRVRHFVDSNKEYTRALMFLKGDPDARVVHIFRSVDHTIASHYFRLSSDRPVKFLKRTYRTRYFKFPLLMLVAFGWTVGMAAAAVLSLRAPGRVLHFSHEAFSRNPRAELERLGTFLGIDLSCVIKKIQDGDAFAIDHLLGGNEFKHRGQVVFQPDTAGRRATPAVYRWCARLLGVPGMIVRTLLIRV